MDILWDKNPINSDNPKLILRHFHSKIGVKMVFCQLCGTAYPTKQIVKYWTRIQVNTYPIVIMTPTGHPNEPLNKFCLVKQMDIIMEELENEVSNIRSNTVAANSRNIYRNSSTRMLVWLLENKPYLLTEEFISLRSNHLPSERKKLYSLCWIVHHCMNH